MKKIKELYQKYKELILYVIFGVLTTLVNLVTFMVCEPLLGEDLYLVSNFIAWVGAALFAFFVNKLFVKRHFY
jgi:putative flippase GtrA